MSPKLRLAVCLALSVAVTGCGGLVTIGQMGLTISAAVADVAGVPQAFEMTQSKSAAS